MKFENPLARMSHPQASLIPLDLWNHQFGRELPDYLLPVMEAKNSDIDDELGKILSSPSLKHFHKRNSAWQAIALSHRDLSVQKLMDIGFSLGFSNEEFMYVTGVYGNLEFLKHMIELLKIADPTGLSVIQMINEAFPLAARGGHLNVIHHLEELAPNKTQLIEANYCKAFRNAAHNGHLNVISHLEESLDEFAPDRVLNFIDLIKTEDYWAFRLAAKGGHLDVIKRLVYLAPQYRVNVLEMIEAQQYQAFIDAAEFGHLHIFDALMVFLKELDHNGDKVKEMIAAQEYRVFRLAAYGGHLHIMESLIQSAPEKSQEMIAAQDYGAFKLAAQGGHLHMIENLIQLAPEKIQEMIAAQDYGAFKKAAKGGHLHMIENLIQLAPEKVQDMIAAEQYRALWEAAESGHQDVVNFLLAYPSVFDYTQTPRNWFVTYVNPFVGDRLRALRAQKTLLGQDAPDAVFDITDANEIKLLCHFLKNLCERYAPNQGDVIKEPELRDDILFLLNIPSVMDSALQNRALIKFSRNLRSTTCLFQQCLFHHKSPGATGGATEMTAGPAQKK